MTAATVVRTNAPRQPEAGYAGAPDERERKGLGRRHRDEDHGELPAPGGDGEPEDGEQEEPAEAGRRSAGGFPEERGERDVADRDRQGGEPRDDAPEEGQREQRGTECRREGHDRVVERDPRRQEEQPVRRDDRDQRERDRVLRRLALRARVGARAPEAGYELGGRCGHLPL